ncbi:hypothetical protein PGTUg99_008919 [Puccinia graminis f. sp. tritici]|uniref:Uncharacterized protein n=1 Tax=Puccinia graminis f. sp. tritici TaxID=56615 RepID=A0A5B0MSE5_PUCGR|nr:hypothetical protein PGTUg99_008919 [Puccinia graminis f. sp. tritici]
MYNPFLELLGFDGVHDTPVEILHVILLGIVKYLARDLVGSVTAANRDELVGRLRSFSISCLNIDSVKPEYLIKHIKSLVGRDFKILLQAGPFFLMSFISPEKQAIWLALCKLAPLIFQSRIGDMTRYLVDLQAHIDIFLYLMIKSTAQWVHKPKLHMLLHLPASIERFGPATLCSTEKFESYNGVLRNASIHSNRCAPGRDIARSFESYASNRFVLSGGVIHDHSTGITRSIGSNVTQFFSHSKVVQWSLGYNADATEDQDEQKLPSSSGVCAPKDDVQPIPVELAGLSGAPSVKQIHHIDIDNKNQVNRGSFVVVPALGVVEWRVGRVESLWQVKSLGRHGLYANITVFSVREVDDFYEMRMILRTKRVVLVNARQNCHKGECRVTRTGTTEQERQQTLVKNWEVTHSDEDHYVINAASFHEADLNRLISRVPVDAVSDTDWAAGIRQGLATWDASTGGGAQESNEELGEDANAADEAEDDESPCLPIFGRQGPSGVAPPVEHDLASHDDTDAEGSTDSMLGPTDPDYSDDDESDGQSQFKEEYEEM